MKKQYYLGKTTILILLFFSLFACTNYKEITTKPIEYSNTFDLVQDTNNIALAMKINYVDLERDINIDLDKTIDEKGTGHWGKMYRSRARNEDYYAKEWIKTYDPLHRPNKWIKTRDPLYTPKAWYELNYFKKKKDSLYHSNQWIKTHDPRYHPNKWIHTKDPLYNPHKYVYSLEQKLDVDYDYKYEIVKGNKITIEEHNQNNLRITIPFKIKGNVGYIGDWAHFLTNDEMQLNAKMNFIVDVAFELDSSWCPTLQSEINHEWVTDPKIQISGNHWMSLKVPEDLSEDKIKAIVEENITKHINREHIEKELTTVWKKTKAQVTENVFADIDPIITAENSLYVQKTQMEMYVKTKAPKNLDAKVIDANSPTFLPKVMKQAQDSGFIKINIPIHVSFVEAQKSANKQFKQDSTRFGVPTPFGPATVNFQSISMYPSGDRVSIAVKLTTKLSKTSKNKLMSTKGVVYLTGKPKVDKGYTLKLEDLKFSNDINKKAFPVLGALFEQSLIKEIEKVTTTSLSEEVNDVKNKTHHLLNTMLKEDPKNKTRLSEPKSRPRGIQISEEQLSVTLQMKMKIIK